MLSLAQIIDTLPSLRATVDAHQLMASKALGQNFLLDQNITDKIIRNSLNAQNKHDFSDSFIYEIGPGPGGLTRASIKANPQAMTVIEMDSRCISIMEELQSKTGKLLQIINGDALKHDYSNQGIPTHIISNLPYNISVPLLVKWLSQIKDFSSLTLMFQKEVADRILAPTHCKDFGRISILAQLQCKITKLFDINPECFTPAPKIWSTVLLFQPRETAISTDQISKLEKVTATAFSARRKMIRQSLKNYNNLEQACKTANIALTSRPEEITPQQFLTLSQIL